MTSYFIIVSILRTKWRMDSMKDIVMKEVDTEMTDIFDVEKCYAGTIISSEKIVKMCTVKELNVELEF